MAFGIARIPDRSGQGEPRAGYVEKGYLPLRSSVFRAISRLLPLIPNAARARSKAPCAIHLPPLPPTGDRLQLFGAIHSECLTSVGRFRRRIPALLLSVRSPAIMSLEHHRMCPFGCPSLKHPRGMPLTRLTYSERQALHLQDELQRYRHVRRFTLAQRRLDACYHVEARAALSGCDRAACARRPASCASSLSGS